MDFFQYPHNKLYFWNDKSTARFIGVEIEIDHVLSANKEFEITNIVKKWKGQIVRDVSIPFGFEINTAPARGKLFVKQITSICAALKKAKAQISTNCGLHVHIDARDLKPFDLIKLLAIYTPREKYYFKLAGRDRISYHWCKPINTSQLWKKIYTPKSKKFRLGAKSILNNFTDDKYQAINFRPFYFDGNNKTIEFRQHSGTINAKKIIYWANICAGTVEYSRTHTLSEIRRQLNKPSFRDLALMLKTSIQSFA